MNELLSTKDLQTLAMEINQADKLAQEHNNKRLMCWGGVGVRFPSTTCWMILVKMPGQLLLRLLKN